MKSKIVSKSISEAEKDLKIKELENEIHHLTIQLRKFKNQASNQHYDGTPLTYKHSQLQIKYNKALKEHKERFKQHLSKVESAKEKYRKLMEKHAERENFLKQAIKKKFGYQAYIDIFNSADNPDEGSRFHTKDRIKRFIDVQKGRK